MPRISAVLVGVLVVAAAAGLPAAAQERVTLTVSVVTAGDDPVSDATLEVSWPGGSTTETTAANGKAFVDVPEGVNVTIEVDHDSYVRNEPVVVTDAATGDVEVTVRPSGSLTTAVSDRNGAVAEASVIVRQDGRIVTNGRTDGDGTFDTGVVEVGTYTVEVIERGYYREHRTVDIDGDVRESVTLERGSVVVEFNVTDPHYSPARPVAAATVSIDGVGTFNTLENGEATARVPVNAALALSVTKDAYEETSRSIDVRESPRTVDVNLSRAPQVVLSTTNERVVAGERVAVEITDEYGDPVAGASVLLDGGAVGESDAEGEFEVRINDPGEHTLRADLDGHSSEPVTVEAVRDGGDDPTTTATAAPTTEAPEETTTAEPTTESGGQPGFAIVAALVALALAALLAAGRSRRRG